MQILNIRTVSLEYFFYISSIIQKYSCIVLSKVAFDWEEMYKEICWLRKCSQQLSWALLRRDRINQQDPGDNYTLYYHMSSSLLKLLWNWNWILSVVKHLPFSVSVVLEISTIQNIKSKLLWTFLLKTFKSIPRYVNLD